MLGWHHRLNGYEFVQTLGDGGEQGSLACCSPWGRKELDVTEQQQEQFALIYVKSPSKTGKWFPNVPMSLRIFC